MGSIHRALGVGPSAANRPRDADAPRAQRTDTTTTPPRTPLRGEAPQGSEPTAPDNEHQGLTSASEEGRRGEPAGEGRVSAPC